MSRGINPAEAMDQAVFVLGRKDDGSLVGVDNASGGYDWYPRHWDQVQKWRSVEEAENYNRIMGEGYKTRPFVVLRANLVITAVDDEV